MTGDERVHLPDDDFRKERVLLSPELFADPGTGADLPATDLVGKPAWVGLVDLPTDVLLRTTSHEGSSVDELHRLTSMWIDMIYLIDDSSSPYMSEASLLSYEEFDALAFIALHGYYRQALGCLRNALEVLTIGAGLAVTQNAMLLSRWRAGDEVKFGNARDWLSTSVEGRRLDSLASPSAVFDRNVPGWLVRLHNRLCGYAHSRAGYNNVDFWESNGPVHVWGILDRIIAETRETMALGMVLLHIGQSGFRMTAPGRDLVDHPDASWADVAGAVQTFLPQSPVTTDS